MTFPVFIREDLNPSNVGDSLTVDGSEGHHAVSVMRLKTGDFVDIVDGLGLRLRSRIIQTGKDSFTAEVLEKTQDTSKGLKLGLVQALAKAGRDEQAVESCVELGISHLVPWKANRCVSVWSGSKVHKGLAKWSNIVFAATKQSRQSRLASVLPFMDSKTLTSFIADPSTVLGVDCKDWRVGFLVLHESADEYLCDLPDGFFDDFDEVFVLVGPEGGITDEELDVFTSLGAVKVRLSDSVLRTSNAGCVALSMIATKTRLWSGK